MFDVELIWQSSHTLETLQQICVKQLLTDQKIFKLDNKKINDDHV